MSSNATVWRTFKFFDQEQVKNAASVEDFETTCAGCGKNLIFLGDINGSVRVIERQSMTCQGSFQAYSKVVTHIKTGKSQNRNLLITIGDDDASDVAIVRIWDGEQLRGKAGSSGPEVQLDVQLFREIKLWSPKVLQPTSMPLRLNYNPDLLVPFKSQENNGPVLSPVVCFDSSELDTYVQIAVALTDSTILVIRGDLTHGPVPKVQSIRTNLTSAALTFVGFAKTPKESQNTGAFASFLFAVFEDVVVAFPLPGRGRDLTALDARAFDVPSRIGADYECAAISDDGTELILADRNNNIVVYGGEKFLQQKKARWEGPFAAAESSSMPPIEGEKRKLTVHKHYFVLLMRQESSRKPEKFTFGIFDRDSRIRAVSMPHSTIVNPAWVLADVSDVMVIWNDAKADRGGSKYKVLKYGEITKQAKFDLLFRKDMYEEAKRIAKQLASSSGASGGKTEDADFDIAKRYGDHLYDKGKYEEAVAQYIEAIRTTEPSYVIRKFLGEQRIANLTTYLEALHETEYGKLANRNHTTLLLNCYAKLKNEADMNKFIRREDISFDAANAIHVCRQAGYYDAALFLAEKYNKPDEKVKILLENQNAYVEAVQYIKRLPLADAERALRTHGKSILSHEPEIGKDLHVRLCTEWVPEGSKSGQRSTAAPTVCTSPEAFMASFVDTPRALMQFLEAVVQMTYQRPTASMARPGTFDSRTAEVLGTLLELYLTPDLPERISHRGTGASEAPSAVAIAAPVAASADEARLSKAYDLLYNYSGMYDPYHALMLSQQYSFERGVIFLLEALKLHSEIFVYYAKQYENAKTVEGRKHAKNELFKVCERKIPGDGGRDMWVSLLSLLVRTPGPAVEEDITTLLERIEQNDLLPPVAVIEILAANPSLELKAVRNYVIKMVKRDQAVIEASQTEIEAMTKTIGQLQNDVMTLQTTAQVFQISKCQQCDQTMEPPAVYFLCNHAFHERCLAERKECNKCGQKHRQHMQMQKDFDAAADKHELFFERLRDARNDAEGFSVVAEQFAKGIFATKWSRAAGDLTATKEAGAADDDFDESDLYSKPEVETW